MIKNNRPSAPVADATATPAADVRWRHPGVKITAGLAWLAVWIWIVYQGGLLPETGSAATLAGLVLIVAEALPVLAAWWLGAAGYGFALRQRGVVQVGVGMAALLLIQYVAGFVVGYRGWLAWGLCGVGVVLLAIQTLRTRKRASSKSLASSGSGPRPAAGTFGLSWWWLLGVPGVAMLIVAACCPPGTVWRVEALGYDVLSYHLQIPREWLASAAGSGMVELEHNVYGYLPGLMESAFASLMVMRGGEPIASVYTAQLFHASFAVLAGAAVASWLRGYVGRGAAAAGGSLLLLVPWVIVTGSMAYNEMVVVAFAAVGLGLVAGAGKPCGRAGVAVGLLAGAATLAKLTAAFTVALPLGGVLGWRLLRDRPWRQAIAPTALCVVVGFAALSPYLVRNAAWTGNPVFPFAGSVMGYGHWDEARAARWDAAHMPDEPWGERVGAVWRQAVGNTGYGALGGSETPRESRNIARFEREGGLPVLWFAAAAGIAAGFVRRETRWLAAVLIAVLLGQVVWWLCMTHLQSRFLVVCIVPLCAAAGLLFGGLSKIKLGTTFTLGGVLAGVVGATLTVVALTTIWSQTTMLTTPDGQRFNAPLWLLVDGLPAPHGTDMMQDLPLNTLPDGSRVMVVGNNQSLFYIQPAMVYASAFDESPFTTLLERTDDPAEVAAQLRQQGVTHLWLGYSEIERLHATYGFDEAVTPRKLQRLVRGWEHLGPRDRPTVLVEVPAE